MHVPLPTELFALLMSMPVVDRHTYLLVLYGSNRRLTLKGFLLAHDQPGQAGDNGPEWA